MILKPKISKMYDFWVFEPVEYNIYSFDYTKMLEKKHET